MGVISDALKRAELIGRLRVRVGVLASQGGDAKHEASPSLGKVGGKRKGLTGIVRGGRALSGPVRQVDPADQLTLVQLAAIHEFGSPAAGIPERSFIRSTFGLYARDELREKMSLLCKAALSGRMDPRTAIDLLGTWAVAQVRRTITAGKVRPPLKPATEARKGSTKPLVDTGQLVNAIAHEVVEEGGVLP